MNRPSRPAIVHMALGAFAVLIVAKSAWLQIWKGGELSARAARTYYRTDTVPAPRGEIRDASGKPLVQSVEQLSLAIAPLELHPWKKKQGKKDRPILERTLIRIGVPPDLRRKALASNGKAKWLEIPGRFMPAALKDVRGMRGVYVQPVFLRTSFASPGARAMLGRVDQVGLAAGGLERLLDRELTGTPGLVRLVTNPGGSRSGEVPARELQRSVPGNTVTLTINREWQNISEWALSDAVHSRSATGGDIVIVNPSTGEILAMASYDTEAGFATTAMVTSPYEPGSSIKPLLAARILELGRARPEDIVETGREMEIPGWRSPLRDLSVAPSRSFHDVIKYSSNIGMVKFSQRLTAREQHEAYRDFGLGMQTGILLPGEAAGRLEAARDSGSRASTAIGYAMSVTSLQMAMAYSAIANGGELLEPSLVKEVRSPSGQLVSRHERRVVRRVIPPSVAAQMRVMLRDVVEGGTATAANINLGEVAGKTGTARLAGANGAYIDGKHIATFAGMFPARNPEFVIVVRLVDPDGTTGGMTAAPVTAAVLKAVAAATDAIVGRPAAGSRPLATNDSFDDEESGADEEIAPVRMQARVIDLRGGRDAPGTSSLPRPVPHVAGLPLRDAVLLLHRAGFRVRLGRKGSHGDSGITSPAAGTSRRPGDLVLLYTGQ